MRQREREKKGDREREREREGGGRKRENSARCRSRIANESPARPRFLQIHRNCQLTFPGGGGGKKTGERVEGKGERGKMRSDRDDSCIIQPPSLPPSLPPFPSRPFLRRAKRRPIEQAFLRSAPIKHDLLILHDSSRRLASLAGVVDGGRGGRRIRPGCNRERFR
jgi:hypothetical protein